MILYLNESANNVVNKKLVEVGVLDIKLPASLDVISPIIKLSRMEIDFNYCFIPEFSRYYFINSVVNRGVISELYLSCDVIYTYKEDILSGNSSYRAPIKSGDFGNISLDTMAVENVSINSGVELDRSNSIILSTIGGV